MSRSTTPISKRKIKQNDDDNVDNAVNLMVKSVTSFIESRKSIPESQTQSKPLKFQQFYESLDEILTQIPYIDALRFTLNSMEDAQKLLLK